MERLVSILVPCFNGAKYLKTFFESIIHQKYRPLEIVLIDDGSTDNTKDLFNYFSAIYSTKDCRFKYVFQNHSGQARAINTGLRNISGSFISWTDVDDILLPNNIKIKVDYLCNHPTIDFVMTNGYYVSDVNSSKLFFWGRKDNTDNRESYFHDLLMENDVSYGPGSILIRKESFERIFPSYSIIESDVGQNWQLILPLSYSLQHHIIDVDCCHYLKHSDSHSHQQRSLTDLLKRNDNFYKLIHNVFLSINSMSRNEFQYYDNLIFLKYFERNLYLCYKHFNFNLSKKYKYLLIEKKMFKHKHTFFGYQVTRCKQLMKYFLRHLKRKKQVN